MLDPVNYTFCYLINVTTFVLCLSPVWLRTGGIVISVSSVRSQ